MRPMGHCSFLIRLKFSGQLQVGVFERPGVLRPGPGRGALQVVGAYGLVQAVAALLQVMRPGPGRLQVVRMANGIW